jgi:hypothetical protein
MKISVYIKTTTIYIAAILINNCLLSNSANAVSLDNTNTKDFLEKHLEQKDIQTDAMTAQNGSAIATFPETIAEVEFTAPFQTAQVYPSETTHQIIEKINPSELPKLDETQSKPNETEQETQKKTENQQKVILDALTNSASKYSFFMNPTDNLTFAPQLFKPNEDKNYIDLDIRFAQDNPIIYKLTFAHFPQQNQFYWVLPNNRVVLETKGWQGGILSQGQSSETDMTRTITLEQAFGGFQAVSLIPQKFDDLTGDVETKDFSVISIAGQITNPPEVAAGEVTINSGIDLTNPNVTFLKNSTLNLGSGSSNSLQGGGSLFEFLDVSNTPLILQGFPTVDFRPLIDDGKVKLEKGEVIPKQVLEATGISWGDITTGKPAVFTAEMTSLPGLKVGQLGKFDNLDLLNTLVNPFPTGLEKDLHYLNSLFWTSYGIRKPKFDVISLKKEEDDWYRVYFSHAHNRAIIEYNPLAVSATYANVFSNPGISLTLNLEDGSLDLTQTINSTLGMVLGLAFEAVDTQNLQHNLDEAKQKLKNGESFSVLQTKATSTERRQINYRLNRTLAYANSSSSLKQVSGTVTLPSKITPSQSNIFQIRTGLYQRAVYFFQQDAQAILEGDTYFSQLRLSNKDFGALTFIGTPIPLNQTSVQLVNESSAAEIIFRNSNGKTFVQQFSSADNTVIPVAIKSSDIAFDRIELTRIDYQNIRYTSFGGYLYLPAVEFNFAGSSGDLNYILNSGIWLNLDSNSAPSVANNNLGIQEPTVGIYANALLSLQEINVEKDADNKPKAIHIHSSSLSLNWNSASNSSNPLVATLSYSYSRQVKHFLFTLTPGLAVIQGSGSPELTMFLNGHFGMTNGLEFNANLEKNQEFFFDLQAIKILSSNISLGAFIKNYSQTNTGLDSRVSNLNYGLLFRHNYKDSGKFFELQLGTGKEGLDARFQGGLRF